MGWLPLVLVEGTLVHPDLTTTGEGRRIGDASLNPISVMGDLIQQVIRSGGNILPLGFPM